jgi:iron complex outermembrane receptor protein
MNGIPLNDAESHGVWWVDLPDFAGSVENVQIQRGAGTSVNGAGAFGASMNFQTFTMHWRPYAEISSSFGSFYTLKNSISVGSGLLGGKFTFDLRLSGVTSDGYIDRAFSDLKSFHFQGGYYTGKTMLKLNIFSGMEKTGLAWIGVPSELLQFNRTFNPAGMIISETGDTSWYENETDNYRQDHYQLIFSNEISPELFFNAALHYTRGKGYYEEYRQDQSFNDYQMEYPIVGSDTIFSTDLVRRKWLDNDFYGLIWSFNCREDKVESYLGGGINRYDGRHFGRVIWAGYSGKNDIDHEWYRGTGLKTDGNIYFKLNYLVSRKLFLYGDLQYRFIHYQLDGIDEDLRDITQINQYNFFNPKFGMNYEWNSNHSLYFAFAVANREPARSDLVDADTTHPAPKHETLYDYEAGYKADLNRFYLHLNFYYMDYHDQLVLTGEINDVGAPVMTNVPESYRAGLEVEAGIHPIYRINWDLNVTLSRNKIKGFTEFVDNWDYWSDPENQPYQFSRDLGRCDLSFSPSFVAGSRITYEIINDLKIMLQSKYIGKQYIDNTSSEERVLDNYLINDLMIRYTFKTKLVREIGVSLQVSNLFNSEYETNAWIYRYFQGGEEHYTDGYFPQAGIHLFGGFTLKF